MAVLRRTVTAGVVACGYLRGAGGGCPPWVGPQGRDDPKDANPSKLYRGDTVLRGWCFCSVPSRFAPSFKRPLVSHSPQGQPSSCVDSGGSTFFTLQAHLLMCASQELQGERRRRGVVGLGDHHHAPTSANEQGLAAAHSEARPSDVTRCA